MSWISALTGQDDAQQETDGEDFGRLQAGLDEYLRTDEGDAPDGHDGQGEQVIEEKRAIVCKCAQM